MTFVEFCSKRVCDSTVQHFFFLSFELEKTRNLKLLAFAEIFQKVELLLAEIYSGILENSVLECGIFNV